MGRSKATEEPNVNEARDRIQKRKELAKSKAVAGDEIVPEITTKAKTPPPSPNAAVPITDPTPEGTLTIYCVYVYLYYALYHRYSALF
jgi:hypothetical protein